MQLHLQEIYHCYLQKNPLCIDYIETVYLFLFFLLNFGFHDMHLGFIRIGFQPFLEFYIEFKTISNFIFKKFSFIFTAFEIFA